MILYLFLLVIGMVLLIKGADFFVDGSSGIAKKIGIPSIVIGLTLVSLGTSAPEISISVTAILNGTSDMSVGNVIGSNICNILLILGVSAIFTPVLISKDIKKYDIPIMIGIFLLLVLFSFVITPNTINFFEGVILAVLFISYIIFLLYRTKKENNEKIEAENEIEEKEDKNINLLKCIIFVVLGLAAIIFGGDLVVENARKIALEFGMSETLVSLTIVSVGSSLPELVTSVVAALKKEGDIAIGNVVGSCIFNILLILSLSAMIAPLGPSVVLSVSSMLLLDLAIMTLAGVSLLVIALTTKKITRWQGIIYLALYVSYIVFIIVRN